MKRWMRMICVALVLSMGAVLATGCNTLEGAGQDIEAGGEAIQDAAN